jgi:hypothetical protein
MGDRGNARAELGALVEHPAILVRAVSPAGLNRTAAN